MKLFYHFLVLVAASLIMVACATMFASSPQKTTGKQAQRTGNNLQDDSLVDPTANSQLIFSDLHHDDFLSGYETPNPEPERNKGFDNLRAAANYLGLGRKGK
ncbi:hypothetical protein AAFN85_06195 [Mucilaginibacter sp. CAU 1740]|uniref:hypothetical protein n=1 Tax=Mucilaginibacter sp. CAU 1740 TaxID=3140365 RepID=UPI00325B568F